jgi:hypothetical protein
VGNVIQLPDVLSGFQLVENASEYLIVLIMKGSLFVEGTCLWKLFFFYFILFFYFYLKVPVLPSSRTGVRFPNLSFGGGFCVSKVIF